MRILFKNGTVIDGSGGKPFRGDVLIEDERIVEVAESIDARVDKTVDVAGRQICPGFIDAHSIKRKEDKK